MGVALSKLTPAKPRSDVTTWIGFGLIACFFIAAGYVSYGNIREIQQDADRVVRTHQTITSVDGLLSIMKDAETGQRGYVITGDRNYLTPFTDAQTALPQALADVDTLTADDHLQSSRFKDMRPYIQAKMAELEETINLRSTRNFAAAQSVVVTNRGKNDMDQIRTDVRAIQRDEEAERDRRLSEMAVAYRNATVSAILAAALGIFLAAAITLMVRRSIILREREEWLQNGVLGLSSAVFGEYHIERLSTKILQFLAEYLDGKVGAFYVIHGYDFRRVGGYGVPAGTPIVDRFEMGDGLLGQAAKDKRPFIVDEVPEGYLTVGSALGHAAPRSLLISPSQADGQVNAVFELGFLRAPDALSLELLQRLTEPIGITVRTALDRAKLEDFNEEVTRQNEELQTQSEELRVSNEELEEQGRALKESQARLELQQVELEQSNTQLEEQTQLLEAERDNLSRAQGELQKRAAELDQASRYKSDFLANMSHELRTPLNSSLILAGLLAENREGNLSIEQVTYAQTIHAAGIDLLTLINDILDLSKIEAGHMDLQVEDVPIESIVKNMVRAFEPAATQKSLALRSEVAADVPGIIRTDSQRLEQILRNLLSNAVKFTEKGQVTLTVSPGPEETVVFSVADTGIGIPEEKHELVFGAFQQADTTTSRKYGGTGLGLSISQQLASLLGGFISLISQPGKGSTFSLTVPVVSNGPVVPEPAPQREPAPVRHRESSGQSGGRLILVVEDDPTFAKILCDMARQHGFECLVAGTANEAVDQIDRSLPSAVLLDVGLPDHSGLSVLDRLKRDVRARHIPVHVVSASDYSQTALSLGAAGYLLKPVTMEEISAAFRTIQDRLEHRTGRVLVVEDDARQLESIKLLLASRDVETVGAGSAAECLRVLESGSFDCMVVDLNLPDASGFSLLETLSSAGRNVAPPVIVYTGRELTADQETQLRKYSHSIIVKGVKSPERLLDEITLFLHQVVSELPREKQRMLEKARDRDDALENRAILLAEDDIRNVFAVTSVLEQRGARVVVARNGREAVEMLQGTQSSGKPPIDLVLMDVMMPEMDGLTAMREIRKNPDLRSLPIIALTAKAMKSDQEACLAAGANDYMAKPLDTEKLLSLVRVWVSR